MEGKPTRHPLAWPVGFERTPAAAREPGPNPRITAGRAAAELVVGLRKLGAAEGSVIVSSNVPVYADGLLGPSRYQTAEDPGVAVYWRTPEGSPIAIACDRFDSVAANLEAVARAVEALRALGWHGSDELLRRALAGFVVADTAGDARAEGRAS